MARAKKTKVTKDRNFLSLNVLRIKEGVKIFPGMFKT